MARNENGIPLDCPCGKAVRCLSEGGSVGGVTDTERPKEGCSSGNNGNVGGVGDSARPENGGSCNHGCHEGGNVGGATDTVPEGNHGECGGRGDCLDNMLLAYVYAPDQKFRLLYSAEDALTHGTLFEELYKPKGVYGNE